MYHRLWIVVIAVVLLAPRSAWAEYAWVTRIKQATANATAKVGQYWDRCSDSCGTTARRWVNNSVDWWSPDARQEAARRVGLRLPEKLQPDDHLIVLVHGLDSDAEYWQDLRPLIEGEGYRVAPLLYPNDQPIADSAGLLAAELTALRAAHPQLKIDILAHSMGGIIARACLEGDDYDGGVGRLVMLAPPNHGSCYSRFSVCCDMVEHFRLWRSDPEWSWTWMITDGLGEARGDIAPGSPFLTDLNARGRRQGVRYTIVAGNRSCGWRYAATAVRWSTVCLPDTQWSSTVGGKLHQWASELEARETSDDGLVEVRNAMLSGVDDVVVVPADHTTIACSRNGCLPVAWPVIKDRLGH